MGKEVIGFNRSEGIIFGAKKEIEEVTFLGVVLRWRAFSEEGF